MSPDFFFDMFLHCKLALEFEFYMPKNNGGVPS